MLRNIIRLLIHPLFIYLIIVTLECIPYVADLKVLHEVPKVGDNFRTKNNATVYYMTEKGKYFYSSEDCFFDYGNPLYETKVKDGGVKMIDEAIVDSIPLLGDMCGKYRIKMLVTREKVPPIRKYLSTNYLLDKFSNISHIACYIFWSLTIMFYFRRRTNNHWMTFAICFLGGGILEFVQKYFIVGRSASWEDQLLNCIGATLGILIYLALKKSRLGKYM